MCVPIIVFGGGGGGGGERKGGERGIRMWVNIQLKLTINISINSFPAKY